MSYVKMAKNKWHKHKVQHIKAPKNNKHIYDIKNYSAKNKL